MFSRFELTMIATAIERAENRRDIQRGIAFGMSRDRALLADFIKSLEQRLADLDENRQQLQDAATFQHFED